jgi:putative ABC transport system ATP-binding protein
MPRLFSRKKNHHNAVEFEAGEVIRLVGIDKTFRNAAGEFPVLKNINVRFYAGEFIGVIGKSGSGKSTLVNMLTGIDHPTSGKVILDGHDLSEYTEEELAALRRQKMGFIFQRHDLFPVLTVRENVEFPMLLNDIAVEERHDQSKQLLNLVGLADKADSLPEELSGGQQQRVGIARALANAASILLADEPTGNLDSATSEDIIDSLIALKQARNLTLIMVTHDPEVAAHADRVLQLKDGKLLSPSERC